MTIYIRIIGLLWLVLFVYWAIAATRTKRNVGRRSWSTQIGLRFVIVVVVVLTLRVPVVRQALRHAQQHAATSALTGALGVACCALGIGIAIWARVHLGRNWGMPMSRKQDPELVTTGPYAFVRHPIYTGIILMMLGSAIAASPFWVVPLILFGAYFVFSARREEAFMVAQFKEQYRDYMKRTKMLLPFVY
jgi:protein-S-isoprenylcysteine O-methyltransferase Ste14